MAAGHLPAIDAIHAGTPFWLVDPLDGTKEFIKRNGEFTVNIALIENGQADLGIVLAPASDTLWRGVAGLGADKSENGGAFAPIAVSQAADDGLTCCASRSMPIYSDLDIWFRGERSQRRRARARRTRR